MSRLADYFLVVGFDHEKERGGVSSGKILQRFPEKDWDDTPFYEGIEYFCQPQGWALSTERCKPKLFVFVLTDIDANRHHCACLCFNETVAITPNKPVDEDEERISEDPTLVRTMPSITHHSIMYAPKCLVLVSSYDYVESLRNCLGIIYTTYIENYAVPIETLVGNILGCIQVPPPGGPQVRFSIGAGDRQSLQPPLSSSLPITHTCVNLLFQQLGIRNVLVLFCAIMTEHKILFYSKSYNRLTDSCRALTALMYPFRYTHVYIPLLPTFLIEILSTPTPFVIGVHSSLRNEISELMDVILADLDGGSIQVPDSVSPIPLLPEPLLANTLESLSLVLQPELLCADDAFLPLAIRAPQPVMLDKEIRAVFMRLFAHLLQGYRTCLTIIRIHPKPVITFHKAAFLGERGLIDCNFTTRVLDCMFFNSFVAERGPPWRQCDAWDDLYSNYGEFLKQEAQDPNLLLSHIQELAQHLYINENPNAQPYPQKIPKPPDGAFERIHLPPFPLINAEKVQNIIDEGLSKDNFKSRLSLRPVHPRIVPMGPPITNIQENREIVSNSARRLEVLKNCVNFIFENRISDARKSFPAVLRALKSKAARLALCSELAQHVIGNKAMLEHQQFDLIVRLMNCALQDDASAIDANGVAAALLPLSTAFCRKLCTGVIQFAYTCIQEHAVWQNQQFWEASFYQDVQKDIKSLYLPHRNDLSSASMSSCDLFNNTSSSSSILSSSSTNSYLKSDSRRSMIRKSLEEASALEIAAEQMRLWNKYDLNKQNELIASEESTVYSQTIHFANRMVYLLIPLNYPFKTNNHYPNLNFDDERISNSITNSVAESDSADTESGFEERDMGETESNVSRIVSRFVDKVCTEGGVNNEHIRSLHQMIPGVVHMHIETLEAVQRESARLPPIQKPKILMPNLLSGEELTMEGLRVYLLPDGREDSNIGHLGGPILLPAEGAIFLTNYRIIFKGTPCDPFACEQTIIRAFPLGSLTKEKRITGQHITHLDQYLQQGGLQLRSCTFQLVKIAFDDEVTVESIDLFRKNLHRLRNPPSIFHYFAFCGQIVVPQPPLLKGKEKNSTLKGFAKKTLLKTARKAGFKQKDKHQKYVLQNNSTNNKYLTSPGRISLPLQDDFSHDDDLSLDDFDTTQIPPSIPNPSTPSHCTDAKTLERLAERNYVRDWYRIGLLNQSSPVIATSTSNGGSGGAGSNLPTSCVRNSKSFNQFRLTTVNTMYYMCRTYPALFIVPTATTDDSLRKFCRCYRQQRIACVTWRHPRTHALLLRGSALHNKGVIGMLKGHPTTHHSSTTSSTETTSTLEHERYLNTLVSATGFRHQRASKIGISDSSLSINSLLLAAGEDHLLLSSSNSSGLGPSGTLTPEIIKRQNPFNKAIGTFGMFPRSSGGKGTSNPQSSNQNAKYFGHKWTGSLNRRHNNQIEKELAVAGTNHTLISRNSSRGHIRLSLGANDRDTLTDSLQTPSFQRAALYVLGEKANMKAIRLESVTNKVDFIPVEYYDIRHTKAAFKKLMRACVPSSVSQEPEQTFFRLIESSEWLNQLQNIMQLSGAVVDLLDVQGSSVAICLEDGCDITTQISSISQLCLDPYYRTLEGFRVLIEKEWIAFGHRFNQRSHFITSSQNTSFTPTFLQFLDIIHQIQKQFPLAFEFNEYYLKFLAYHSVSCRFRTFLFDCEVERVECGVAAVEDKRGSLTSHHKEVVDNTGSDEEGVYPGGGRTNSTSATNSIGPPNLGQSVFDYIEKQHSRTPLFYNFLYTPDLDNPVLRPQSQIPCLEIWQYYIDEELSHGPSYDLEVVQMDCQQDEEAEAAEGITPKTNRKTVSTGYDNVNRSIPDAFSYLLEEIHRLETELGHLPQKWKVLWDKLELPTTDSLTRHESFSTALIRYHGRMLHKRSTLEILLRGKMVGAAETAAAAAAHVYSHPHRFERYNYTTFTHCDLCEGVLFGPVKTGVKCVDCGYCCHEKCIENVPKNCTKYKTVQDTSFTTSGQTLNSRNIQDTPSVNSNVRQTSSQQYYDQFSSNVAEHRTHEGYLYKRGALLKGWKQRWFVLDSNKHQLRYYDAMEDSHCKGYIDLAEVIHVTPVTTVPQQNAPKKTDEKSLYFDLKTSRRTYNLCAVDNVAAAQEWIDKINACLQ